MAKRVSFKVQSRVRYSAARWQGITPDQQVVAAEEIRREFLKTARRMASGKLPMSFLRRYRPYARSRDNKPEMPFEVPPLPINQHTGALKRAMKIQTEMWPDRIEVSLTARHRHAFVLAEGGTLHMIDREYIPTLNLKTRGIARRVIYRMFRDSFVSARRQQVI